MSPTIVSGGGIENSLVYQEETFGPFVALTTFKSVDEAIEKANRNDYGLLACIFTSNPKLASNIASRLEAGTVVINEMGYTAGLAETPWGGLKHSGFGRSHSAEGLLAFTHQRHIHSSISSIFNHKALWGFPYSPHQFKAFRSFIELYRASWFKKIKALPDLIYSFILFIKNEPRL